MMEMLTSSAAVMLLLLLVAMVAGVVITVRVLGSRATEGDHPGERGYDPDQHRQL